MMMHGEPKVGRTKYEDEHTPVADQGLFEGKTPNEDRVNEIIQQLSEGRSAKEELAILKPVLAFALSKLPRKQLRVRAEDMDTIGEEYLMQSKSDGQGGIILRSVKVL
jgi:hypothetical protein